MPSAKPVVCFGEILWRLSPPNHELLLQSHRLDAWLGGAETNVATALARLGHAPRIASAVPDDALGSAATAALRAHGVDTAQVRHAPGRMGLYFVTPGAGLRATEVTYDRAMSAFAQMPVEAWDWEAILEGAGRLHLSGITPALGPNGTRTALAAARAAADRGVPISFDGNWRGRLWEAWDGTPRETLHALVTHADILFGNHRDIGLLLGQHYSGDGEERRREAAEAAFAAFPNLATIASTARHVAGSHLHQVSARIDQRAHAVQTEEIAIPDIVDRIGAGDAFAAGVLHGLIEEQPLDQVARTGLALTALKHSLPGDASLFTRRDLAAFLEGGLDVRR